MRRKENEGGGRAEAGYAKLRSLLWGSMKYQVEPRLVLSRASLAILSLQRELWLER